MAHKIKIEPAAHFNGLNTVTLNGNMTIFSEDGNINASAILTMEDEEGKATPGGGSYNTNVQVNRKDLGKDGADTATIKQLNEAVAKQILKELNLKPAKKV